MIKSSLNIYINFIIIGLSQALPHLNMTPSYKQVRKTDIINYRDIEYHITINFGSDRTPFDVLIDTGSSDLWLPDKKCTGCLQKKRYSCSSSKSCNLNKAGVIFGEYADGPIMGYQAFDDMTFSPDVSLKNQSFILVFKTSGNVATTNGILGLGFQALAMNSQPTLLSNLLKSGKDLKIKLERKN